MSRQVKEDFGNLRKVVEAIDEITDDGQIEGPKLEEVASELDVSRATASRWAEGNYSHAVRTAGLIPQKGSNTGDYMAVYDFLSDAVGAITENSLKEESPLSPLSQKEKNLSRRQAREKLGLEPDAGFNPRVYGNDRVNFEHRLRGVILDFIKENDRLPSKTELDERANYRKEMNRESRERASFPVEPVSVKGGGDEAMSAKRENEVFDFWVNEYLEEDWEDYDSIEVDAIVKLRMAQRDVTEDELNAVADNYNKWVDFARYES